MGGLSITHLLVFLLVVVLIFGTKKLGSFGEDLGKAVKGFKDGIKSDEEKKPAAQVNDSATVDVDAKEKK